MKKEELTQKLLIDAFKYDKINLNVIKISLLKENILFNYCID